MRTYLLDELFQRPVLFHVQLGDEGLLPLPAIRGDENLRTKRE